jgi:hypothetical protein
MLGAISDLVTLLPATVVTLLRRANAEGDTRLADRCLRYIASDPARVTNLTGALDCPNPASVDIVLVCEEPRVQGGGGGSFVASSGSARLGTPLTGGVPGTMGFVVHRSPRVYAHQCVLEATELRAGLARLVHSHGRGARDNEHCASSRAAGIDPEALTVVDLGTAAAPAAVALLVRWAYARFTYRAQSSASDRSLPPSTRELAADLDAHPDIDLLRVCDVFGARTLCDTVQQRVVLDGVDPSEVQVLHAHSVESGHHVLASRCAAAVRDAFRAAAGLISARRSTAAAQAAELASYGDVLIRDAFPRLWVKFCTFTDADQVQQHHGGGSGAGAGGAGGSLLCVGPAAPRSGASLLAVVRLLLAEMPFTCAHERVAVLSGHAGPTSLTLPIGYTVSIDTAVPRLTAAPGGVPQLQVCLQCNVVLGIEAAGLVPLERRLLCARVARLNDLYRDFTGRAALSDDNPLLTGAGGDAAGAVGHLDNTSRDSDGYFGADGEFKPHPKQRAEGNEHENTSANEHDGPRSIVAAHSYSAQCDRTLPALAPYLSSKHSSGAGPRASAVALALLRDLANVWLSANDASGALGSTLTSDLLNLITIAGAAVRVDATEPTMDATRGTLKGALVPAVDIARVLARLINAGCDDEQASPKHCRQWIVRAGLDGTLGPRAALAADQDLNIACGTQDWWAHLLANMNDEKK